MRLRRRRRHMLVERSEWAQLIAALNLRDDREAAEAVRAAPRQLDGSDPRVARALDLLAALREGAPVNPEQKPDTGQPRIAVDLAKNDACRRQLWAIREAHLRRAAE